MKKIFDNLSASVTVQVCIAICFVMMALGAFFHWYAWGMGWMLALVAFQANFTFLNKNYY